MHTLTRNGSTWGARLLGIPAVLLLAVAGAAWAATLPTATGTLDAATNTRTFDLWAKTGTTNLGLVGPSLSIAGYTDAAAGAVTLPGGPMLIANQGETIVVNLTNNLAETTSLLFQGQALAPDLTGATAGSSKSYTFAASSPGTFLYEAGLLSNTQYQAAMGLYGALIVRPAAANQAYNDVATAFADEALLVLSELDPAANSSGFDMRNYAPKYFLINGKAYPGTDAIPSVAGNAILLRYVNAGVQHHSMALLGLRQRVVAKDGSLLPTSNVAVVAEPLAPGQTADGIATVPVATLNGSKFAAYDGSLMLHNSGAPGFGGMLTFVTVGAGAGNTGPATSAVVLAPNPTDGSADVALSASVSDAASGNSSVIAAEYFIDSPGADGAGTLMSGTFGTPTVAVSATLSAAQLAGLSSGKHNVYVHGLDDDPDPKWGGFNVAVLNLDKTGPVTSGLTLTPNPSSGTVNVALHATGNETTTGGSNVVAAEYFVGAVGANGTGTPMSVNVAAPVASLDATILCAVGSPCAGGTVSVHSKDVLGSWGAFATIMLNVVTAGPTTTSVTAAPNPNNGALPLNSSNFVVRVTASMTSAGSTIAAAEGFIDTVGGTGTGLPFLPSDGLFNGATETGFVDIPLSTINTLATGNHTINVRGRDAAGNWGATTAMTLVIDRTAPTASAATVVSPASNNTPVVVSATATDTACVPSICVIGGGEYYIDTVGTPGTGAAMTRAAPSLSTTISATIPAATIAALTAGNHTLNVRSRDAAGNWSSGTTSTTLLIDRTAPTFASITLTPNSIPAGTASVGLAVNGADDPLVAGLASGVAGGEWWIGTTNITAGTGTQFAGTSGVSVATGALTACTYTVRTRIRDVAGNWSTGGNGVRTAQLVVTGTPDDAIFADGFETGTLNPLTGWSSRSTTTASRLTVSAAAALVGAFGLQAQGNNTNYVQYDFGACPPASPTFDARFYFNPNGFTPNGGFTTQDIFVARTTGGTTVFRVRYRMNAGQSQVQIQVGTGTGNTAWTNINNNASNRVEVVWQAVGSGGPSPGTLVLHVNGASSQTLGTTSTNSVGGARLGSVTDAGNAGNTTLEYFDAFASKRSVSPLIGP